MSALRILLAMGCALWLLYEQRRRQLGSPIPHRTVKAVLGAIIVLAFGAYFDFFNPNTRFPDFYHRHELYHHYLGAKYSREIGYTRLYVCAAVAEVELGRGAEVARAEIRDLRTNRIQPVRETFVLSDPSRCKQHFSPAKWEAFKKDVDWFAAVSRGTYWENMRKDFGFHGPPVWSLTAKPLVSLGAAGDELFKLLCLPDVLLQAGMLVLFVWAFGWRVGAIAAVFMGCNGVSTFYWTGGAFLRQDWLFLLVAGVCLARKRKMFLAGAALTWAALLRLIPAAFLVGWLIVIALHALRQHRKRGPLLRPEHRRVLAGALVAFSVLVPASIAVTGPSSYKELFASLEVFRNTPMTDDVGLETILVHDWDGRMRFARDDSLTDPFERWTSGRVKRYRRLRFVHLGIVVLVLGWTIRALWRVGALWIAPAVMAPFVMSIVNLPNYYFSFFIVCAVLAKVRPAVGPLLLTATGASQILLLSFYWVDDKYAAQAWLFWIFSVTLLWTMSPLSRQKLARAPR